MSHRQATILRELQSGAASAYTLAGIVNAPDASVRRDIQALRRAGWNINDARDNNGLYRLAPAAV